MLSTGMISLFIRSVSAEQARHFRDGCVEDVEDELRRDADGEHEQRDRNNDEFFASPKIDNRRAIRASGPLKSACIARMKAIAVTSKTEHGDRGEDGGERQRRL